LYQNDVKIIQIILVIIIEIMNYYMIIVSIIGKKYIVFQNYIERKKLLKHITR